MSGTRKRRQPITASEDAHTKAAMLANEFQAVHDNRGGAVTNYGPAVKEIVEHCDAFLHLDDVIRSKVDLSIFAGPRDRTKSAGDGGAFPPVLDAYDAAYKAVKRLRDSAREVTPYMKLAGNARTQSAKALLLELAKVWESDTSTPASQKLGGPFGRFAETYMLRAGFRLTKVLLERAMNERPPREFFGFPARKN